jgi:hypothetical protein
MSISRCKVRDDMTYCSCTWFFSLLSDHTPKDVRLSQYVTMCSRAQTGFNAIIKWLGWGSWPQYSDLAYFSPEDRNFLFLQNTEKPLANYMTCHGNLSFAPWKIAGRRHNMTEDLGSLRAHAGLCTLTTPSLPNVPASLRGLCSPRHIPWLLSLTCQLPGGRTLKFFPVFS